MPQSPEVIDAVSLFDVMPVAALRLDSEARITASNEAAHQLFGQVDQFHNRFAEEVLVSPTDIARFRHQFSRALSGEVLRAQLWDFAGKSVSCDLMLQGDNVLLVCCDVGTQKRAEAILRNTETKYRELLTNSIVGIFSTTPSGEWIEWNESVLEIFGYESDAQFRQDSAQSLNIFTRNEFYLEPDRNDEFTRLLKKYHEVRDFESEIFRKDGEVIWVEENIRAVYDESGTLVRYNGTVHDITNRKLRESHLLRHAFHDKLTGLPDRALFLERLNRCFKRRQRRSNYWFAVLFLDLDRFKIVNDSLGHVLGDQLLVDTARKLEACVRPGDTVARLGGDEFAILLDDVPEELVDNATKAGGATLVAERIQSKLAVPSILDGHQIYSTASIGIAVVSEVYDRPEDLLRDADMAMYRAKASGKACHAVFDAAMYADGKNLLQLEADLRRASDNNELRVEYQPVVDLRTGRIAGFEAFLRWHHPTRGLVPPSEFVPVAEETGLLVKMDRWALEQACRQMVVWQNDYSVLGLKTMCVNLSSRQFAQTDFIEEIGRIVHDSGLPPHCLRLEMTERSLLANPDAVEATILQLKALGIQLSLDDFGTGYSSLAYLHRFNFDALKVDRSFVSRMDNIKNEEIVRAVVLIAHNLSLKVIAEGVETVEQLARLRAIDCHYGQGYLFSGPLEHAAATELILTKPQW